MSMPVIKVTTEIEIKPELVQDLFICALEGGSNYWYSQLCPLKETSTKSTPSERLYDDLLTHGFEIEDKEVGRLHRITPDRIKRGTILFYRDQTKHYNDAVSENSDAITGDVFLQSIVFGEVIYG